MTQLDWQVNNRKEFVLTITEFEEDLEELKDRYAEHGDWYIFYQLINESAAITGGLQGNSNYRLMSYKDILTLIDHALYVKVWKQLYFAHAKADLADRIAIQDVAIKHQFFLKNLFGETYRSDWQFMVDAEDNDMGDITGFYHIYAWSKLTPPVYELEQGREIRFVEIQIPKGWEVEDNAV
jgi:hypothetical protein